MSDNRVISTSKYTVIGVTRTTTDNYISKKNYTTTPDSHSKKQDTHDSNNKKKNTSDSSNNPLNSISSSDDSTTFLNELDNKLRLQSEENLRLVQSKFNNNTLKHSISKENIAETELHNKLSQAMNIEVDASTLSKKIELLNSLRNESNDSNN